MPWPVGARGILHADMDAFYASVEQRDDPALRGKPVIVGGIGRRGVVAAASYEARKFGVRSAMPTAVAKRRCPDGIYVHPRMSVYAEASAEIRAVFEEITPLVEPLSLDEAFLDVTGSRDLFGEPARIARRIKDQVKKRTQLTISVGVAGCKYVAKVASDLEKPDGLVVVQPGAEAEFLAPLPVGRLWGAGKVTQERMAKLGLHKIGDLQQKRLEELVSLLGPRMGQHYFELSRGVDERPVIVARDPKSVSHEVTFSEDLQDREDCNRVMLELAEKVGRRLRSQRLLGQVVRLKLRDPDFTTYSRQRKLSRPTDDELLIHKTVRDLFDVARPQMAPVRLLGVGVGELVARDTRQKVLFQNQMETPDEEERPRELLDALDRIRDRFGEDAIHHGDAGSEHQEDGLYGPG